MKTPFYKEFGKLKPELLKKISDYYGENLLGLAIYGSAARGDLTVSSDIDLIIILKNSNLSPRERIQEFFEHIAEDVVLLGYSLALSPLIFTSEEIKPFNPFFLNFLEAFEVLYEREGTFSEILKRLQDYLNSGKIKRESLDGIIYYHYEL